MYEKAAKLEKQMDAKLAWLLEKYYYRSQESVGCSSSQADLYLTEKELQQLHLYEEALRETLEEKAMDKKAREDKIRQKQADDDEFFLEFGVTHQSSAPQLDDKDLEQLDQDNLEEIDIKWQKRPFCQAPRNQWNRNGDAGYRSRDNTRRTVPVETSDALVVQDNALIVQDGLGYDWSYIAQDEPTEFALMALHSNSSGSDQIVNLVLKTVLKHMKNFKKLFDDKRQTFSKLNLEIVVILGLEFVEAQLVVHQKNEVVYEEKIAVLEFEVKDKGEFDSRFKCGDESKTKIGLDDSVYRPTANKTSSNVSRVETSNTPPSNTSVEMPRVESVRPSGVIIEDWVSDDEEDIFQSKDSQTTGKGPQETNGNTCLKKNVDAGQNEEENVSTQQYIVFLLWSSISSSYKSSYDKAGDDTVNDDACKTVQEPTSEYDQALKNVLDKMMDQEKEATEQSYAVRKEFEAQCDSQLLQEKNTRASSTNSFNTVSTPVNTASASRTFSLVGPSSGPLFVLFGGSFPIDVANLPLDPLMPELEDTTEIRSAEADFNNMEPSNVNSGEHAMISYIQKQRRTNHKDFQNSLFACFLSQHEPTKISQALDDESWVEAMNKTDERGIVVRNKARLVAQGYKQEEDINYDEIFAPVARVKAIRLFLAFASFMNFPVYQMDVKSAFLYGTIEEEGDILLVQVYVDDIIFGSTKKSLCDEFEQIMHNRFQMSSMGELTFFLGLQVKQKEDGIFINQDKYVREILKKFGFFSIRSASTQMETHKPLTKYEDGEDVDVHLYRSMIESLMYLTSSRLDIMFSVCACSRFQVQPKVSHLHAVKRIFRYLKVTMQCKKQTVVANSTTEAEYIAASHWLVTLKLLRQILILLGERGRDTKIPQSGVPPIKVGDEAVNKELGDRMERAATTGSSFEAEICGLHKLRTPLLWQTLNELIKTITEASLRRHLKLKDNGGVTTLPNSEIFEQLALMGEMLDDFDRQDVLDLHRLVKARYMTSSPKGYDLMLWGDLKILFEPDEEDEV
ncbi:putative ribonuclease H-like domain-containing protein [Tanacetum coccineum]